MNYILMNKDMTKAILDGRKAQTRRVVKEIERLDANLYYTSRGRYYKNEIIEYLSKYQKGNTIWVREPARVVSFNINTFTAEYLADGVSKITKIPDRFCLSNLSKENKDVSPFRKQLFSGWIWNKQGVPNGCIKEMARIFLKVTDVRVERLEDIEFEDMIKEGVYKEYHNTKCSCGRSLDGQSFCMRCHIESNIRDEDCEFVNLWNSTAPKGYKREDNPYVFVYEFERVKKGKL